MKKNSEFPGNTSKERENLLERVNSGIAFLEKILLVIILTAMIGVSIIEIVLRNFFETDISSADIIIRHLILWVCFIGASLTTFERRHIKIDLVHQFVPKKYAKWVSVFVDIFCVVVCIWLGKAGYDFLMDEYQQGGILTGNIPRWTLMVVIPIWFFIMAFRFGIHGITDLKEKAS